MPIIIILFAYFFAIGLLLVKDPSRLPMPLQLVRHGLKTNLKWLLYVLPIFLVLLTVGGGYGYYLEIQREKREIERKKNEKKFPTTVEDFYPNKKKEVEEKIPEYGTDKYCRWRLDNIDKAREIEAKLKKEGKKSKV